MPKKVAKKEEQVGTIQKYCLIYSDAANGERHEIYDKKPQLRRRLNEIDRESVQAIFKGRLLRVRVEERLTV